MKKYAIAGVIFGLIIYFISLVFYIPFVGNILYYISGAFIVDILFQGKGEEVIGYMLILGIVLSVLLFMIYGIIIGKILNK